MHSNRTPNSPLALSLLAIPGFHAPSYAILVAANKWAPGTTLGINFLGGTSAQQDLVVKTAQKWLDLTQMNLKFQYGMSGGQIRISFDPNLGAWSYIGTDAVNIPAHAATMNYGWLDEAVILHEFAHAIGFGHEHQSPFSNPIQWNKARVLADAGGPPNYWNESVVQFNIFDRYSISQVNGTEFDPKSIMLYWFPPEWTLDGLSMSSNSKLSPMDIALAKTYYPPTTVFLPNLPVSRMITLKSEIAAGGQISEFELNITEPGTYTIETEGTTDTYMSVWQGSTLLAKDDDSGVSNNASVTLSLSVGKYKISIRHYSKTGKGAFGIKAIQR